MKEQSSAYLGKARELLDQADAILRMGLNEPAGRTAYLAGFHAAQAVTSKPAGGSTRAIPACMASLPGW